MQIIFMQVLGNDRGKVYAQTTDGFANWVRNYGLTEPLRRSQGIALLAQYEIEFLLGVASGCGAIGWVAVTATDVGRMVVENRATISAVFRIWVAMAEAQQVLLARSPRFYALAYKTFWRIVWKGLKASVQVAGKDVAQHVPDAAVTPGVAARAAGGLAASVGMAGLAGKLAPGKVLLQVATAVLGKIPSTAIGAVSLTAKDYKQYAGQLITALKLMGASLSEHDARAVLDELVVAGPAIRPAIAKLQAAFMALKC